MSIYSPQCPVCKESFDNKGFYQVRWRDMWKVWFPMCWNCPKCQAKLKHNNWWWGLNLGVTGMFGFWFVGMDSALPPESSLLGDTGFLGSISIFFGFTCVIFVIVSMRYIKLVKVED